MRQTVFFLGLCALWLLPFTISAQESPLAVQVKGGTLHGTLLLPQSPAKRMPLAVLVAGSGPTDRDGNQPQLKNNSLRLLAEGLAAQGIASLRFDKRGIAQSKEAAIKEDDLRFEDYASDIRAWVELLSRDKRFGNIYLLGHSEGSLLSMLAAQGNAQVKGVVSIAGAGRPIDEVLKEQLRPQPQPIQDMVIPMLDQLKRGERIENVPQMLYALFRPSVQGYMISWMQQDPAKVAASLSQPLMVVQGDNDLQVSVQDAERLLQAQPKAVKALLPDMNHVLKSCQAKDMFGQMAAYTSPDLPLHPELLKVVADFVKGGE